MVAMKNVLQSVALALAVLLAVQPPLVAEPCTQMHCSVGHHLADCCPSSREGSMQNMSGDSAMHSRQAASLIEAQPKLAQASCGLEPCCSTAVRTTVQAAIAAKSKVTTKISLTPVSVVSSVAVPFRMALTSGEAAAPAPARYVVCRILRI